MHVWVHAALACLHVWVVKLAQLRQHADRIGVRLHLSGRVGRARLPRPRPPILKRAPALQRAPDAALRECNGPQSVIGRPQRQAKLSKL